MKTQRKGSHRLKADGGNKTSPRSGLRSRRRRRFSRDPARAERGTGPTDAEVLMDELVNEIGPRLRAKGITEENIVAEMRQVRKTLSWKKLRKLSGAVSLGGDALADSEALYNGE